MGTNLGRANVALVGMSAVLLMAGCSSPEAPDPALSTGPAVLEWPMPSPTPTQTSMPTLTPTPSPTPTSSSTTKPSSPATSPPTSSPGSTEAPQLSPEEQAAQQEFEACAEWYADQVANVRLTGVITPELLEQWADAYDEGAGLAADGDPIAANQACQQLRSEMQPLLGAI